MSEAGGGGGWGSATKRQKKINRIHFYLTTYLLNENNPEYIHNRASLFVQTIIHIKT